MSVDNEVRARGRAGAATRVVLVIALGIAVLLVAGSALASLGALVQQIAGPLPATLPVDAPLPGGVVHGPLVDATYRTAEVLVAGAPADVAVPAALAAAAGVLVRLSLGVALILLLAAVLRRRPFSEAVALGITLSGAAAVVGSLLQTGLGTLADWMLADLLTAAGSGTWPMQADVAPAPLVAGFGLMVIGLLVSHGVRLQRATDGLV